MLTRLAFLAGRTVARAESLVRGPKNDAVYHGASTGRRSRGWYAPTTSPNAAVLASARTLRDRSRSAVRNDGYAKSMLQKLTTNIVGTDVAVRSQAPDPEFRQRLHELWTRWTGESDADGLLPWSGQLALAVHGWLEGGETFVRLRPRLATDGLAVPLQVQLIEPELCPIDHNGTNGANLIRAGVEFSPIGRRVAYWFYRSRPGELSDVDTSRLVRLSADVIQHLYLPLRAGQLRGLPHLTTALLRLRDVDEGDDATLYRWKLANMFMMFVKRAAPKPGDSEINPTTGLPIERDAADRPLMPMEPGLVQELDYDETLEFSKPPGPGEQYADFIRQQLMAACVAGDVPYEVVTNDLTKVNDRTVRVILNEFRRRIEQLQYHIIIHQVCRPVWRTFVNRAVLAGAVVAPSAFFADPEPWLAAKYIAQGWPYIHPVQDVQADREAIRAGLKSRTDAVSERGYDVEEVDAEIAADNERADNLGLVLTSDPRKTDNSGSLVSDDEAAGGQETQPAPAPAPRPRPMREGE